MKLSRWAEAFGLVAVVLSLIFVGIEIRHSTQASRAANQHSLLELAIAHQNTILESEELSYIFSAVLDGDVSGLSESQRARADRMRVNMFNIWEAAYYDHQTDQLSDELWTAWNSFNASLANEEFRSWWQGERYGFGSSFAEHVDEVMKDVGSK